MPIKYTSKTIKNKSSLDQKSHSIPDDLDSLNRTQLQSLAKKHGIPANSKTETIKRNLKNFSLKSKLSHVTRLDTQLPRDMQDLVFEKVYLMANPEIEEKIKSILDKKTYPGDDYLQYNYSKIREKLKIKHNTKEKDLQNKVEIFRHKYVRLGVIYNYFQIEEIIQYFDYIDGVNEYAREDVDFDSYFRKLKPTEQSLRTYIKNYNIAAEKLKEFDSYIKAEHINKINKFITNFRKVAKFDKKLGKIPYLKYGTNTHNPNSLSLTKKTRSVKTNTLKNNNSRKLSKISTMNRTI